jgi:hypothetical protein
MIGWLKTQWRALGNKRDASAAVTESPDSVEGGRHTMRCATVGILVQEMLAAIDNEEEGEG